MTAKELSGLTGLSIGRISQLTKGFRLGQEYKPAKFKDGLHYKRVYGRIVYYDEAVNFINQLKNKGQNNDSL